MADLVPRESGKGGGLQSVQVSFKASFGREEEGSSVQKNTQNWPELYRLLLPGTGTEEEMEVR